MKLYLRPFAGLVTAIALAACSGSSAPTPLASAVAAASIDTAAFCSGSAPEASALAAVAAATTAAAASGGALALDNAEPQVDSALAGLRGLTVTGEADTARDEAVTAVEKLRSELPNPSVDTTRAASEAITAFTAAQQTFC
ncbi:MAG: hypothetical protein H0X16_03610 [Chloroflexi bacterium]|nr:hypothetical protein [Chloroflexota bacterium]